LLGASTDAKVDGKIVVGGSDPQLNDVRAKRAKLEVRPDLVMLCKCAC
jgi:hypothetical protein